MKKSKIKYLKITSLLAFIVLLSVSCERDLSDDATLSTFSKNGEVFIDAFSAGLGYGAFGGSKYTAFTVDSEVKYLGTASMRFDVPSVGDPDGAYAGGVFIDGSGRNLTDYDALTFWVKGSQAASLNELGFGTDFGENKYNVALQNVSIDTNWKKITIPIPDASKLIQEKGMFWYSEGPENGLGYTFWIDNVKYEKLGTIAHPQPKILEGLNSTEQTFIGTNITLSGLTETFNLASGINETISVAPSYFTFTSSNTSVATVSSLGVVSVVGTGTSIITASLGGTNATGSLTVTSIGAFTPAPTPTLPSTNVISLFSNAYSNVPVDYFNGYWGGSQTLSNDFTVNGDNVLSYYNFLYFGIAFTNPFINATTMNFMHLDIHVPASNTSTSKSMRIRIRDFGANGLDNQGGVDDTDKTIVLNNANLVSNSWNSIEIPMNIANKSKLGLIVFDQGTNLSKFYIDNIYFHN
jgi:hypothetical protein